MNSAHDIVLSTCHLPPHSGLVQNTSENIEAIKVPNNRIKIMWDGENIELYQSLVGPHLIRVRENWSDQNFPAAVSILLQTTNTILSTCAVASNKVVHLGMHFSTKCVIDP